MYRASHLHPSFMPDCFRGDAPPRAWADCLRILFLMRVNLFAVMHVKENMKPLILVAPETQVNARNHLEDQLLARQHT